MPALISNDFSGTVVWLGRVPDRINSLQAEPMQSVFASYAGVEGEDHAGLTRPSCSRVVTQYPRDTEIRNTRQFSVVCAQELQTIAEKMGLPSVDPSWIGASMVISGIPDFSHIPPSSRLQIAGIATLTADIQNRPCHLPAKIIEEHAEGFGRAFKQAAVGLRGVTAWVEREGEIHVGDPVALHIPEQRPWREMDA